MRSSELFSSCLVVPAIETFSPYNFPQIITSNAMQEQLGSSIATTENLQIIREKTRK